MRWPGRGEPAFILASPGSLALSTAAANPAFAEGVSAHYGPDEPLRKLALGAVGVVYGDIGTSPLYSLKESLVGPHPLPVDPAHIFGVLSLFFWTLTLVVTVKYVLIIM